MKSPLDDGELLKRLASRLPDQDPPDALWQRIHAGLHRAPVPVGRTQHYAFLPPLFRRSPRLALAMLILVVTLGTGSAIFLLSRSTHPTFVTTDSSGGGEDMEMLYEAQDDIDNAVRYYESAIEKLTVVATKAETKLNPEFVQLQKERIAGLRQSIDDCNEALRNNKMHPQVQFYLLTAYNDLQGTLQEMITQANSL